MDHPVVSTFRGLVGSLTALAPFEASLSNARMGVAITAQGGMLVVVDHNGLAAPLAGHLHSSHQKMALASLADQIGARARAWHRACAAVPGLLPLCGDGVLSVSFDDGPLALAWQPSESLWAHAHVPSPVPGAEDAFAGFLAAAVAGDGQGHPTLAPLTFFHPHYQMPDLCGVETTPALARALAPMIYAMDPKDPLVRPPRIGGDGHTFTTTDLLEADPLAIYPWDQDAYQAALPTYKALRAFSQWVGKTRPDALAWGTIRTPFPQLPHLPRDLRFATVDLKNVDPRPDGPDGHLGAWAAEAVARWDAFVARIPPTATWYLHQQAFRLSYQRPHSPERHPGEVLPLTRGMHRHELHLYDAESVDQRLPLSRTVPWFIPRGGPLWWTLLDPDMPVLLPIQAHTALEAARWAIALYPPLNRDKEVMVWRQIP